MVNSFKVTGLHPLNENAANYTANSELAAASRNPEQQEAHEQAVAAGSLLKRLRPTHTLEQSMVTQRCAHQHA